VPPPLPRFRAQLEAMDRAKLDAILRVVVAVIDAKTTTVTNHTDYQRMRGIPIVGPGVRGVQPRTDPLAELLRKEARGELHL
jgi:hypothetical protein